MRSARKLVVWHLEKDEKVSVNHYIWLQLFNPWSSIGRKYPPGEHQF
jgi:hypothetical protein